VSELRHFASQVTLYFHKYFLVVWFIATMRLTRDDSQGDHRGIWSGGSFQTILYSLLYVSFCTSLASVSLIIDRVSFPDSA
jgi:hypothetical protein